MAFFRENFFRAGFWADDFFVGVTEGTVTPPTPTAVLVDTITIAGKGRGIAFAGASRIISITGAGRNTGIN